ncbi:MAG: hypothetical protein AAFN77_24265 [Planctomycetota bacterium]
MNPNAPQVVLAKKLYADKSEKFEDICTTLQISKSTPLPLSVDGISATIEVPTNASFPFSFSSTTTD